LWQSVAELFSGDGGIRTLDRALQPYNGLANRRLQPLGHISGKADMPDAGASRKRQISGCRIPSHLTPGVSSEALKRILEAEAGNIGAAGASQMRSGLRDVASRIFCLCQSALPFRVVARLKVRVR
jgi:hypothetical protein